MAIHVKNIVKEEKPEARKPSELSSIRLNGKRNVVAVNVIKANEHKKEEPKVEQPKETPVKTFEQLRESVSSNSAQETPSAYRKPMSEWLKKKDSEYINLLTEN